MKILRHSSLLIFLFLINCGNTNSGSTDLNNLNITGSLSKLVEKKYTLKRDSNSSAKKILVKTAIYQFNAAGNIATFTIVNNHVFFAKKYTGKFIYNSNNQKIKEIGRLDSIEIEVRYFYHDTLLIRTSGESRVSNGDFGAIQTQDYIYRNRKLKSCVSKSFSIDKNSNDTLLIGSNTFLYNSKGLLSEVNWDTINSPGQWAKTIYKRNRDGLIIKELKISRLNGLKSDISYEYEYDNLNNWIKLKKSENGKITELIERELHYR